MATLHHTNNRTTLLPPSLPPSPRRAHTQKDVCVFFALHFEGHSTRTGAEGVQVLPRSLCTVHVLPSLCTHSCLSLPLAAKVSHLSVSLSCPNTIRKVHHILSPNIPNRLEASISGFRRTQIIKNHDNAASHRPPPQYGPSFRTSQR